MIYADATIIDSTINSLLNRNPSGEFSATGDTGAEADARYSDDGVTAARRMAGQRILEAIGKNIAHPFWSQLKTDVTVEHGAVIPVCYGEIGIPLIQSHEDAEFEEGMEADADEINSYRSDLLGTFSDFYGTGNGLAHNATSEAGMTSAFTRYYSTANGVLKFTGYACKIPMIVMPTVEDAENTFVDEHIPLPLAALNVKLALPLLTKEGDSLIRVSSWLGGIGEAELYAVGGGAVEVKPIDFTRAIQLGQRYNS